MKKKETIITLRDPHSTEEHTHIDFVSYADFLLENYEVL